MSDPRLTSDFFIRNVSTLGRSSDLLPFLKPTAAITLACLLCSTAAHAHEYWLDPLDTVLAPNKRLLVDARNGQDFVGSAFPYDPSRFSSAVFKGPTGTQAITSDLGDYPAFHVVPTQTGTYQLAITTTQNLLAYKTRDDFDEFLDYHGFDNAELKASLINQTIKENEGSKAAELPEFNIQEGYYRYAKTFVRVTDDDNNETSTDHQQSLEHNPEHSPGHSPEHNLGLTTEHTLELTPRTDPTLCAQTLELTLTYQQSPVANRQVEVFYRDASDDKTLTRSLSRTSDTGKTTIDTARSGDYLVNSVIIDAPDRPGLNLTSHWASLTFSCQ